MTGAETERREELAAMLHDMWLLTARNVLLTIEPLLRDVSRRPEHHTAWAAFDRLVFLVTKKWACLQPHERGPAFANADAVLELFKELGAV